MLSRYVFKLAFGGLLMASLVVMLGCRGTSPRRCGSSCQNYSANDQVPTQAPPSVPPEGMHQRH